MVFSDYQKQRILYYWCLGKSHAEIARRLTEDGRTATKVGVLKFLRRYKQTGTHSRRPGTGKASKTTDNAKRIIEEQMNKDDETTGCELQKLLSKHGITVCASTALRWRQQLGWTSKGTSYCQMIREVNKEKRLAWAIKNKGMFLEDVIYTDETTVQIESCELFTLMDIVLYKTMTLSIALTMQEDSMKKGELVGCPLLQSHQI